MRNFQACGIGIVGSLLELHGVRVHLDGTVVLDDVDLVVRRGQLLTLIGPNGSGKTTLLRAAAGILAPSRGVVMVDSHDMARDPRAAKDLLGFAVEPSRLPDVLTGRECLELFASARRLAGVPRATFALCRSFALTGALDRHVETYSLGMRQKLGIALGTMGEPPLLLLDESFNGLDPRSAVMLRGYLRDRMASGEMSVVVATHDLAWAEHHATRVALMLDGHVRRLWEAPQLAALRSGAEGSLEAQMVAACTP